MTKVAKHDRTCSSLFHLLQDVKVGISACDHVKMFKSFELLRRRVTTRGYKIILEDLPNLGKVIDKALSTGFFEKQLVPQGLAVSGGDFIFSELIYRLFRRSGDLIDPADPGEVFFVRCVLYHYKKVEMTASNEATEKAMGDFCRIDGSISHQHSFDWSSIDLEPSEQLLEYNTHHPRFGDGIGFPAGLSRSDQDRLDYLDYVTKLIVPQSLHIDWWNFRPKHGPGAVSDLPGGSDKYVFPSWPRRLSKVFPTNGWASHVHDCHEDSLPESWGDDLPSSKLICVPKTYEKPRVIASEPTAHMYCQQAIMNYLRDSLPALLSGVVNFYDQGPSREMALAASKDGNLSTIDLSSASDRLTIWAVERVFSRNIPLLDALWATSTRSIEIPVRGKDKSNWHRLKKFAPMGSAVTFPVQSIFYAVVAIAAATYRSNWESSLPSYFDLLKISKDIRVFGDDIICPSNKAEDVCSLLTLCGLVVNDAKTHTRGLFRESCGMDAYAGVDVTPLYMRSLRSRHHLGTGIVSWLQVSNNAYEKGLWNLSNWMVRQIPKEFLRNIPIAYRPMPCASLFTYIRSSESLPLTRRWNRDLQQTEYKVICTEVKLRVERRNDWNDLLQYYVESPRTARSYRWNQVAKTQLGYLSSYRTRVVVRWVILR